MTLDFRQQKYQETADELQDIWKKVGKDNFFKVKDTYLQSKDIDPEDFNKAFRDERDFFERNPDAEDIPKVGDMMDRIGGRMFGEIGRGIGAGYDLTLGKIMPDDWEETIVQEFTDIVGEDGVKEMHAMFDPYHGEDVKGQAEMMLGVLGSYAIPISLLAKAGAAVKGVNSLKKLGLSPNKATKINKFLSSKPMKLTGYGTAGVATDMLIEDPSYRLVYEIADNEEASKIMDKLSEDPEDLRSQARLGSFLESLQYEAGFASIPLLVPMWRALKKSGVVGKVTTPLKTGWLGRNFTSLGGTDDTTALLTLLRKQAPQAAYERAAGFAHQAKKTFDKNFRGLSKEERQRKIEIANNFLMRKAPLNEREQRIFDEHEKIIRKEYDKTQADTLLPAHGRGELETADETVRKARKKHDKSAAYRSVREEGFSPQLIKELELMRKNVDELSKDVKGSSLSGPMAATFDANMDSYLRRSYQYFLEPKFKKKMDKQIKRYLESQQRGGRPIAKGEIDTNIIEVGEFFKNKLGIDPHTINKGTGKTNLEEAFEKIQKFDPKSNALFDFAGISQLGSKTSKSLKQRNPRLQEVVKKFWGESKDPFDNYVNSFTTLSIMKAQADYTRDLTDHILKNIVKRGDRNSRAQVASGDIGRERLNEALEGLNKKVFGEQADKLNNHVKNAVKKYRINEEVERIRQIKSRKGDAIDEDEIRIIAENRIRRQPEEDLFVGKEYVKFIDNNLNPKELGSFMRAWAGSKGLTQQMKTIYSPTTHGRNIMGNVAILAANGIVPFGTAFPALRDISKRYAGLTDKELAEKFARYNELGIVGSRVDLGLIRDNMKTWAKQSDDEIVETLRKKGKLTKVPKKTTELYQAEDDIFKIMHFEETKKTMRKAYPDASLKEIEEMASQRTRDLMPNYAKVPEAFKALRMSPLGDFMAFPAEMTRISKNLVKYTIDDFLSDSPVLRRSAAKRLAGMGVVGSLPLIMENITASQHGITPEQQEALEPELDPWYQDTGRLYLSPIHRDADGTMRLEIMNLGPLDPFSYIKTAASGLQRAIFTENISPNEAMEIAVQTLEKTVNPFLGSSMLTDAVLDAATGRERVFEPGSIGHFLQDTVGHALGDAGIPAGEEIGMGASMLIQPFKPGFIEYLERKAQLQNAIQASKAKHSDHIHDRLPWASNFGIDVLNPTGMDFSTKGRKLDPGSLDLPAFFGLKSERVDLTHSLRRALKREMREHKDARDDFIKDLAKPNPTIEDNETLIDSYARANKKALQSQKGVRDILNNYEILGYEFANPQAQFKDIFEQALSRGDKDITDREIRYLQAAAQNTFQPIEFPEDWQSKYPGTGRGMYDTRALGYIYDELRGEKLEKESSDDD